MIEFLSKIFQIPEEYVVGSVWELSLLLGALAIFSVVFLAWGLYQIYRPK